MCAPIHMKSEAVYKKNKERLSDRCNRLRCPLARLSGLQCFNMGHDGHGINMYGVVVILMGNLHAGGQSNLGQLSLSHRC